MPRVLDTVRILDFTHALAGPYCTKLQRDLGAEVIKIEPVKVGDATRRLFYVIPEARERGGGFFMQFNWGKNSLALDLRHPQGINVIRDLVKVCDVVVENFSPGAMARLGLDYESLRQINPTLIMCSVSGFGESGPWAHIRSADWVVQAFTGAMWMTGEADGPPTYLGIPVGDTVGGLMACMAIAHALYYRERTGKGQYIDISLADSLFSMHAHSVQLYLMSKGEIKPKREGSREPRYPPQGMYKGKDGYINIMVSGDERWTHLVEVMGKPELISDPNFATARARRHNNTEVFRVVQEWVESFDSVWEVFELLQAAGISSMPVLSVEQACDHPQMAHRNMLPEMELPKAGKIRMMNNPVRYLETETHIQGLPPILGEHSWGTICDLLGHSREFFEELESSGVTQRPDVE